MRMQIADTSDKMSETISGKDKGEIAQRTALRLAAIRPDAYHGQQTESQDFIQETTPWNTL
jgi:hypothetical protein